MKKHITLTETIVNSSEISIDNRLKEKKFTEENSAVIKSKMDTARAFIREHRLADVEKLKKELTR